MKLRQKIVLPLLAFMLAIGSCTTQKSNENSKIIAEVGGKKLMASELQKSIPGDFLTEDDSIEFVNEYINKWINQQLLVSEVEKYLTYEERDVSNELEEYRQELLIHKFKNKKFSKISESEVKMKAIQDYYKTHINLFKLEAPIVRVDYIIFPIEFDLPTNFKTQLLSTDENDQKTCEDLIFQYAKKYDNFDDNWIYLQQFQEAGKLLIDDVEDYLLKNKVVEFEKDNERHIINFRDFMMAEESAPLEFVQARISSLIINQKKLDFLRQFKDSLYYAALKYNNFRVYNN